MGAHLEKKESLNSKEVYGRVDASPLTPYYQIGQGENFVADVTPSRQTNSLEMYMQHEKAIQKEKEKEEQQKFRLRYDQQLYDQQLREDQLKSNYQESTSYGASWIPDAAMKPPK